MFKNILCFLILLLLSPFSVLSARDINLDGIYIKKTSPEYKKLVIEKLEVYEKTGAEFVDRDVIFAMWQSGDDILYIKEFGSLKTNYIYKYKLSVRKKTQICKIKGIITIARLSPDKKFIVLKRFVNNKPGQIIPSGETVIVNAETGNDAVLKSDYAFLDFSISPDSSSLLLEDRKGINEFNLKTKKYKNILNKRKYSGIIIASNPSIAFYSPDKQNLLVMNGSGGNYKAGIFGKNEMTVSGISSSSEVFWLDNFTIVYRAGYTGNFSIISYNIKNNKKTALIRNSYNTNLCYSAHPKIITFLKEQVILVYDRLEKELINTGIEGEDVSFDPNGYRFISLLYKKLFIVNQSTITRKRIELNRSWKEILSVYKDLKKKKSCHENPYSGLYIDRKIEVYSGLSGR